VLVLKVVNEQGAWQGCLRFVDREGQPVPGLLEGQPVPGQGWLLLTPWR
jgi:hypothetical protein